MKMMMLSKLFSAREGAGGGLGADPMMLMMLSAGGNDLFQDMFDGAFEPDEEKEV